jgi:hypothetical protein
MERRAYAGRRQPPASPRESPSGFRRSIPVFGDGPVKTVTISRSKRPKFVAQDSQSSAASPSTSVTGLGDGTLTRETAAGAERAARQLSIPDMTTERSARVAFGRPFTLDRERNAAEHRRDVSET